MKYKIIISLLFILVTGCKTQPIIKYDIKSECKGLVGWRTMYDFNYINKNTHNKIFPKFDISKPNRIFYFKQSTKTLQNMELCSYDMLTNSIVNIMPLYFTKCPSINSENQLLGNHFTELLLIDINTQSRISLDTTNVSRIQATWLNDDDIAYVEKKKIYNPDGTTVQGGSYTLKITKKNGAIIDTFQNISPHWTGLSGNVKGEIVYSQRINQGIDQAIIYLNIHNRKKDTLYITKDDKIAPLQLVWNPQNLSDIYWTCLKGIYKTNVFTKLTTQIKEGCETKKYEYIDISPNGKKIIAQRQDKTQMPDTLTVMREYNLFLMNIDGTNEQKIELP